MVTPAHMALWDAVCTTDKAYTKRFTRGGGFKGTATNATWLAREATRRFGPCGIGAEVAARVADAGFDALDAPVRRLNGAFTPTPYSPPLEQAVVPDVPAIVAAIRGLLAE